MSFGNNRESNRFVDWERARGVWEGTRTTSLNLHKSIEGGRGRRNYSKKVKNRGRSAQFQGIRTRVRGEKETKLVYVIRKGIKAKCPRRAVLGVDQICGANKSRCQRRGKALRHLLMKLLHRGEGTWWHAKVKLKGKRGGGWLWRK